MAGLVPEELRHDKKPKRNIRWDKDRDKAAWGTPWCRTFGGDRSIDHHPARAEKIQARAVLARATGAGGTDPC